MHTSASKQHKNQENAFTYKHTCGWEQTKIIVRPKLLLIHVHHPNEKKRRKNKHQTIRAAHGDKTKAKKRYTRLHQHIPTQPGNAFTYKQGRHGNKLT